MWRGWVDLLIKRRRFLSEKLGIWYQAAIKERGRRKEEND